MSEYIKREDVISILASKGASWDAYNKVQQLPAADLVERAYVRDKFNWLRSRCRIGAEKYFDREQFDLLQIITVRDKEERKHGEWETIPFKCGSIMLYMPYCSLCGARPTEIGWEYRPNYCPNCGADMRGGK